MCSNKDYYATATKDAATSNLSNYDQMILNDRNHDGRMYIYTSVRIPEIAWTPMESCSHCASVTISRMEQADVSI